VPLYGIPCNGGFIFGGKPESAQFFWMPAFAGMTNDFFAVKKIQTELLSNIDMVPSFLYFE